MMKFLYVPRNLDQIVGMSAIVDRCDQGRLRVEKATVILVPGKPYSVEEYEDDLGQLIHQRKKLQQVSLGEDDHATEGHPA